jgi:hypothetical protein
VWREGPARFQGGLCRILVRVFVNGCCQCPCTTDLQCLLQASMSRDKRVAVSETKREGGGDPWRYRKVRGPDMTLTRITTTPKQPHFHHQSRVLKIKT